MSTAEQFLNAEEIADFIRESKIAPQWFYGDEGRELGLCPYVTFYVHHQAEDYMAVAAKFIDIWDRFGRLIDEPFQQIYKSRTQTWLKAGDRRLAGNPRAEAAFLREENRPFLLAGTSKDSPDASPQWSYSAHVTNNHWHCYSTVKLVFSHAWRQENNEARWREFVLDCVRALQPEQCYMGFEVGNGDLGIMGSHESDVLERISTDYFYGLDIDHPTKMGFHANFPDETGIVLPSDLGAGLRPPTWCFMLSPVWQRKLGKTEHQVRAELADPRIKITAVPYPRDTLNPDGANGLWIELGDLALYPVEDGVPELLIKANRLIRPIRCDELKLNTLDPWEGDPNPRFGYESSLRWMRRFDEDSDWPSAEVRRQPPPSAPPSAQHSDAAESRNLAVRHAYPDDPCPQTGNWRAPRLDNRIAHVERGQPMPGPANTQSGVVIWYLQTE